jgi:AcrR family transcriptional regulator
MTGPQSGGADSVDESLAARAVRRRIADRQAAAESEVRRLLDAGLELMRTDPTAAPKVSDLVRLAGVSNDAFYRAFRSKDDLMATIVDEGGRRLLGYVRHQRDKSADPAEQLRLCLRAVLQQAADPEVAATSRAVLSNASRALWARAIALVDLKRQIALIMEKPLAGLGSADPGRDAFLLSCAVFGAMEQFLWSEQSPTPAEFDFLCAWALRSVTVARGSLGEESLKVPGSVDG